MPTFDVKLTVRVTADVTHAEAADRVQKAIEADQARTSAYVVSIDQVVKAKQQ